MEQSLPAVGAPVEPTVMQNHGGEMVDVAMPASCVCDPEGWAGSPVNAVCDSFIGDGDKWHETCSRCEHDEACHLTPNTQLGP